MGASSPLSSTPPRLLFPPHPRRQMNFSGSLLILVGIKELTELIRWVVLSGEGSTSVFVRYAPLIFLPFGDLEKSPRTA